MREYAILLVDDDQLILKTQSFILREKGIKITTAQDGAMAIDLLKTQHFDRVITDLVMGAINGIQVLKKSQRD